MVNVPIRYAIMINVAVMPTVRNVYFILQIPLLVIIVLYLVMMINTYLCLFFCFFFSFKSIRVVKSNSLWAELLNEWASCSTSE